MGVSVSATAVTMAGARLRSGSGRRELMLVVAPQYAMQPTTTQQRNRHLVEEQQAQDGTPREHFEDLC